MSRARPFKAVTKYGAKRTNGYASKRESQYADLLRMQKQTGEVRWWCEQVPFRLPGGSKYVVDFMVCMKDGAIKFVEVKGFETAAWKLKMGLFEAAHPEAFALLEVVK